MPFEQKDRSGRVWTVFTAAEVESMVRERAGDKKYDLVQFVGSDTSVIGGWPSISMLQAKQGETDERER